MDVALAHQIRSIAFPSIATGVYHFPVAEAAKIAVRTVKEFAAEHPGCFDRIVWVLRGDDMLQVYQSELERWKASETVNSPGFYALNRI